MQESLKELLARLSKFYWSDHVPENYVIIRPDNKQEAGIGKIAYRDYAAFNLAWAKCEGHWNSLTAQQNLVNAFKFYSSYTALEMEQAKVGDLVCLLKPSKLLYRIEEDAILSKDNKLILSRVVAMGRELEGIR